MVHTNTCKEILNYFKCEIFLWSDEMHHKYFQGGKDVIIMPLSFNLLRILICHLGITLTSNIKYFMWIYELINIKLREYFLNFGYSKYAIHLWKDFAW